MHPIAIPVVLASTPSKHLCNACMPPTLVFKASRVYPLDSSRAVGEQCMYVVGSTSDIGLRISAQ